MKDFNVKNSVVENHTVESSGCAMSELNSKIKHLAIIMDGNRRWENQNLGINSKCNRKYDGYRHGADVLKNTMLDVISFKISYLTVYAFSSENWARSIKDIAIIMNIGLQWLDDNLNFLMQNNIKCRIIGNREMLPGDAANRIHEIEEHTRNNSGLHFQIALSYGARDEIFRACVKFSKYLKDGFSPNQEHLERCLDTADIPDPDLLIRTGGQKRLSNYMLWQLAYTELCFQDVMWPDFSRENLLDAIVEFSKTHRRFGSS